MDCKSFSENKILYLYGELTSEEKIALKTHLESCSHCRLEFQGLRQTAGLLKELEEKTPSEKCLSNIRHLVRESDTSLLKKFAEMFVFQKVLAKQTILATCAVAAIVLVCIYTKVHFREVVTCPEWEDLFLEEKLSQVEEDVELALSDYSIVDELYEPDTFEDKLNRIEEEVNELHDEIKSV